MSKNIEKCKGEDTLSEIVSVTSDDVKLNGLVSNDVADMYQKASGLRPLKPIDTYESPIVELKANLKLIFRRLFSVPLTILGSNKESNPISIISMIEQMFNHYRERLKGSETYGIPSRLSQLSDLPSAPLLVADRKISGVPDAEDGISLVHLLANSTANATIKELTDNTTGWELSTFDKIKSAFPGLERMHLNCTGVILDGKQIKGWQALKIVDAPNITELRRPRGDYGAIINNQALEQVLLPGTTVAHCAWSDGPCIYQCTNMWKLVLGTLTEMRYVVWEDSVNLIHLEIGADTAISMDWGRWSPTNALDPTGTDLVEDPTAHPTWNNLQQFLQNVRLYIMLRLTKRTSTSQLTLTLSPAVYQKVYGLDTNYNVDPSAFAQTATLGDLGITAEDLTETEVAAGITVNTIYATWLDTYRGAIYWNIGHS